MAAASPFAPVPPELQSILDELRQCEPIFHRAAFGTTVEDFARLMAPDYWEVGASGSRYSRESILALMAERPFTDAENEGWTCTDFGVRALGDETYLLTYTLDQKGRITRRATLWQRVSGVWKILYHQGTMVSAESGNSLPA
ncbi:MAG: DUF4440 domain-containing protein [Acidobacteriota bacterium]|nr:DUF4440 domain-containing protein [Acidobacteriota bacterium]